MKASIPARFGPCTGSWQSREKHANAGNSGLTPSIKNTSYWRRRPMNYGRGISRSCWARRSGTYFYLYVILDVFSRYVVGWMVAQRESAEMARKLIEDTCRKQQIEAGQLNIHADRGSSMTSKPVAFLLADLGVTKTHSRPHVSDDNPYSESQFRTMKYRPDFPDRFGSIQHSRIHSQLFFSWYNEEHRHSGIGLLTPAMVHYGQADHIFQKRQFVLDATYLAHPERFVRSSPKPLSVPKEV